MSETTIKFFPLNPRNGFHESEIARIREFLLAENSHSIVFDSIRVEHFGKIQFIDCGANLSRIVCARCSKEIVHSAWQDAMDADYSVELGFKLDTHLKCPCGFTTNLLGLRYKEHCGFASACISVRVVTHFWTGWLLHMPWIGIVEARY